MELKIESMKNMKVAVEKCLDELMKKSDLTPSETKAALDGFKLHDELCCRIEDCENDEKDMKNGYSGHNIPYHSYHITSYGMPERANSERSYGHMGYINAPQGRSEEHQRNSYGYCQNNFMPDYQMRSYNGESYYNSQEYSDRGRGYSRHSISDRVVSVVEKMMDSVESEYERQELQKYIRAIRAMGMTE